jgi:hypothetical protein
VIRIIKRRGERIKKYRRRFIKGNAVLFEVRCRLFAIPMVPASAILRSPVNCA